MNLHFLRGYWVAWKILPISGKALLIGGYAVSAFIYWSATIATPSQNAQCLTGPCVVEAQQIETTKIMGLALLGGMTAMFIVALTAISVVMTNHPEKATRLLGKFDGVSTQDFWNRLSNPIRKKGLSIRLRLAFIAIWGFNVVTWTLLLRLVKPESFWGLVAANSLVTLGSFLITVGTILLKRLE